MVPRSAFERARPVYNLSTSIVMRDNERSLHETPGPGREPTRKISHPFDFSAIVPVNDRFGFTFSASTFPVYTGVAFMQNTWRPAITVTDGATGAPVDPYNLNNYFLNTATSGHLDTVNVERSSAGLFAVSAFRRDFENFFATAVFNATPEFLGLYGLDPAMYGDYDVSTQTNLPTPVRMTGIDFNYKQALTFLPNWARGVQLFANASAQRATGDDSNSLSGYTPRTAPICPGKGGFQTVNKLDLFTPSLGVQGV